MAVGGAAAIFFVGGWSVLALMSVDFYASPANAKLWHNAGFGVLFVMWALMMAVMMLPVAIPFLRLFARCAPHLPHQWAAAAGGYLTLWTLFSVAAAALQMAANAAGGMSDSMALAHSPWRAALFAVAGIYQLTPLKMACLRGCRPPPIFLLLHWRPGIGGAFATGAKHGLYCIGCCWALMLLLFVGGIMDFRWIAALTIYAVVEKIAPPQPLAHAVGGGLLLLAVFELSGL